MLDKTKILKRFGAPRNIDRRLAIIGVASFLVLAGGVIGVLLLNRSLVTVAAEPTAAVLPATLDTSPAAPKPAPTTTGGSIAVSSGGGTVAKVAAPIPAGAVATTSSWTGVPLYVDPNNTASAYVSANPGATGAGLIARMGQQPTAAWFGDWNPDVKAAVADYVGKAAAAHAMPVLVAYDIPNRDCSGYSGGGAHSEAEYSAWMSQFASGIGSSPAVVILEPDAISLENCLTADQAAARNRELSNAITTLAGGAATRVYLDAGHSGWWSAQDTANHLKAAGVANATGFSLNVSNFGTTASNTDFGSQVSRLVGGKHFVIDTGRNGNGPATDGQWCNPSGRALGALPTSSTGASLVDAYLWIKTPWQSDGTCGGGPAAGFDFWSYAIGLAQAAGW